MIDREFDKEINLKQRLVEAAAKVFAEKGFSQATIREICGQAEANIAAVNYYWGDKEKLYERVIEELIVRASQSYPLNEAIDESQPPEARLKKFIELFLYRLLDSGRPAWTGKIMAWEMTLPTEAVTIVLDKLIKPTFEVLASIVRDIYGSDVSKEKVKLAVASIIAQCVFYFNAGNIMDKLEEKELLPEFHLEDVIEHITDFSLRALGRD
jgi:AcrR family transcriptional regulator